MIPLSLYIHFPWCVQKCPYCDFNSHNIDKTLLTLPPKKQQQHLHAQQMAYVEVLIREIQYWLPYIWGRRIQSIFIGGGTPSLIAPSAMQVLFSALRSYLTILPHAEITLEANPGTADQENFHAYRELGINRLSIGVQSFNNDHLKKLGRIHCADEAINAYEMAKNAGFERINLDLMFGLPNQSINQAMQDLDIAIQLNPEHLSYYQLTLEPNTYFHAYPPSLPDDEHIETMQLSGQECLAQAGFIQYEVSAYAQHRQHITECLHNRNYWEFGDYLGIGAGAHGKITMMNEEKIYRSSVLRHPQSYLQKGATTAGLDRYSIIEPQDIAFEFMLNALRLKKGIPRHLWKERTFLSNEHIASQLSTLVTQGLLLDDPHQLCTTERGFQYLNQVLQQFITS